MRNLQLYHRIRSVSHLSDFQMNVLVGTMLGDGHLSPTYSGRHYRLQIAHGNAQKEYVWWKYDIFRNFTASEPKYQTINHSWRFRTLSHPEFTDLAKLFYQERRKQVPMAITQHMASPISLAVWFMDDGTMHSNNTFSLCTYGFISEENIVLRNVLEENYGINGRIVYDGKGNKIYISAKNGKKFKDLLREHIIPSMRYKIGLTP